MDENAQAVAPKVLHQRFKSTGALASSATTTNVKGGVKRTAFAEISNLSRNVVRDDSHIGTKSPAVANEKAAVAAMPRAEKVSAPLQRPAQRGFGASKAETIAAVAREIGLDPAIAAATAAAVTAPLNLRGMLRRPTAVKPDSAVYKDRPVEEGVPVGQPVEKRAATIAEDAEPTSIGHRESAAIQNGPRAKAERPKANDKRPLAIERDEGVRIKEVAYTETASVKVPVAGGPYGGTIESEEAEAARIGRPSTAGAQPKQQHQQQQHYHHVTETYREAHEGYGGVVVDEEDEQYVDDDGYTTARSFRSRGDNTTGGAPTVVFPPRVTAKDRRDIQLAKQVVEGSRTVEQLEDDLYDPSMVAEYSDEIFEYMGELEVCISLFSSSHWEKRCILALVQPFGEAVPDILFSNLLRPVMRFHIIDVVHGASCR